MARRRNTPPINENNATTANRGLESARVGSEPCFTPGNALAFQRQWRSRRGFFFVAYLSWECEIRCIIFPIKVEIKSNRTAKLTSRISWKNTKKCCYPSNNLLHFLYLYCYFENELRRENCS